MKNIQEIARKLANGLSLEQMRQGTTLNFYTGTPDPAAQKRLAAYKTKINSEPPEKKNMVVHRGFAQEMEYNDARKKFWNILQMRAATIAMVENKPDFEWTFTPDHINNIKNMLLWIINDPTSEFPLQKGLFVFGPSGTGKTELMTAVGKFAQQQKLSKAFTFVSMLDVYSDAKTDSGSLDLHTYHDRAFDEFGKETGTIINYGNLIDPNEKVLEARYRKSKGVGQITHLITNATPGEVKTMFTPALTDRIKSMCSPVLFGGESMR
jgi:hypothetical protein